MSSRWILLLVLSGSLLFSSVAVAQSDEGAPDEAIEEGSDAVEESQPAPEPELSRYDELVAEATAKYQAGDFAGAAALLEEAYQEEANANILYNLGRLYEDLGETDKAMERYGAYAKAPGVDVAQRKDALERLKVFKELEALEEAERAKAEAKEKEKEKAEVVTKRDPPPVVVKEEASGLTIWGGVLTGVGGAALLSGGVVALLAKSAHSDFEDATTIEERRSAADDVDLFAPMADGLMIGGGVVAATGIVMLIIGLNSESTQTVLAPTVGGEQLGFALTTRF